MNLDVSKRIMDMAEAHLLNVQRELQALAQRKTEIDSEISKLEGYLKDGIEAVSSNPTDEGTTDD
jgi:hypothetical protein